MVAGPEGMTLRIVTRGRVTGREHVATTWFSRTDAGIYIAARHGTDSDWLRNSLAAGSVQLRHRRTSWEATVTLVDDAEETGAAVDAFADKYAKYPDVIAAWRAHAPVFARFVLRG